MLERFQYDVALNTPDGVTVHRVAITAGDRLRAEREAPRHRLPDAKKAPQTYTSLWLWCGLVREDVITVGYQEFVSDVLVEFDVVKGPDGKPAKEAVGPTTPAPSGSPSPSPPTSAADPTTGSTTSSTSDS
jgi:hypothetical protein